jgi:hypothetical protein
VGLVAHFAGHYFHYDSKFWQTLKALWFSPGKLTLAYWNKQRMRYIPPISLYIFISAVYFLLQSVTDVKKPSGHLVTERSRDTISTPVANVVLDQAPTEADSALNNKEEVRGTNEFASIDNYLNNKFDLIKKKHGDPADYIKEHVWHTFPKLFFFMIPFMALILKMLFFRRKELMFVNHAIFSLHYHALWFSVFALLALNPIKHIENILHVVLFAIVARYLVVSQKRVYGLGSGQAIFYTFTIGFLYTILLGSLLLADILLMLWLA